MAWQHWKHKWLAIFGIAVLVLFILYLALNFAPFLIAGHAGAIAFVGSSLFLAVTSLRQRRWKAATFYVALAVAMVISEIALLRLGITLDEIRARRQLDTYTEEVSRLRSAGAPDVPTSAQLQTENGKKIVARHISGQYVVMFLKPHDRGGVVFFSDGSPPDEWAGGKPKHLTGNWYTF